MDKVFVAHVTTDSSDHYLFAFKNKPTVAEVIEKVWKSEGEIEELSWYEDTTGVDIQECVVE